MPFNKIRPVRQRTSTLLYRSKSTSSSSRAGVIQRTIFLTLLMTEMAMTLARGSALPGVRRARTTCIALASFLHAQGGEGNGSLQAEQHGAFAMLRDVHV